MTDIIKSHDGWQTHIGIVTTIIREICKTMLIKVTYWHVTPTFYSIISFAAFGIRLELINSMWKLPLCVV